MKLMIQRWRSLLILGGLFCLLQGWGIVPSAQAVTQISLTHLAYQECAPEVGAGAVTSGVTQSGHCFIISGEAENKSGKTVVDADVFGRIFDANNNPVMQNRGRLGAIAEIPPGLSPFEFRITIPADQLPPLTLEKFKASGFSGTVRPHSIMDEEENI
jgi:hypothetical protein